MIELRDTRREDLPILFAQQLDPDACAMAAFPSRDRADFMAHEEQVLADPEAIKRTILADGAVAGYASCFGPSDEREVAYWLGREFWGRGIATEALRQLLSEIVERPLTARVAEHNLASLRVLEKCGFERRGSEVASDGVTEIELVLGPWGSSRPSVS
jgi:RimJ/RimL family protein N-acetyltransferase